MNPTKLYFKDSVAFHFFSPILFGGERLSNTAESIKDMAKLEKGWGIDHGQIVHMETIELALEIEMIRYLFPDQFTTTAFPNPDGAVSVKFYLGDDVFQVDVNDDGSLDLAHEKGQGLNYEEIEFVEDISKHTIEQKLREIATLWNSSEFYQLDNLMFRPDASKALFSDQTETEYPQYPSHVSINPNAYCVTM